MEKEHQQLRCDSDVIDSIAVHLQLDKVRRQARLNSWLCRQDHAFGVGSASGRELDTTVSSISFVSITWLTEFWL